MENIAELSNLQNVSGFQRSYNSVFVVSSSTQDNVCERLYIFQLNHWTERSVSEILLDDLQNCFRKI